MKESLKKALDSVDMLYNDLVEIANDIVKKCTRNIDSLIDGAIKNVNNLTNAYLQDLMLKISLVSFNFSEIKEKSALKATCAESLRKEAYAKEFTMGEGAVATKENNATLNISNEIMAEAIYDLVSSLLKTKLDESHRVVDAIKSVLMTRMQEQKFMNASASDDPDSYKTLQQIDEENSRRI